PHGGWTGPLMADHRRYNSEVFQSARAFLLGRRTYEIFTTYWPTVRNESDEIARALNTLPKNAASRTLETASWAETTVISAVPREVGDLKRRPGQPILALGSSRLAQTLIDHDLVDEYQLWLHPVVLGEGKRLFRENGRRRDLTLVDSRTTGKGLVILTYERPVSDSSAMSPCRRTWCAAESPGSSARRPRTSACRMARRVGAFPVSRWSALQAVIAGEVILPGARDYNQERKPAIARFHDVYPAAIVRCNTPGDVAEAIAFARLTGAPTAPRRGGHCFAGRSSSEGIVIDVTPMKAVSVSDGIATIGAGARLGEVYESLNAYDLTIAAGSCPSVAIAGLTLGGGLGILGRKYGLTSDQLLGAQVVLADGRIVDCDDDHDRDLFWALRGAGSGNFGVVTSL